MFYSVEVKTQEHFTAGFLLLRDPKILTRDCLSGFFMIFIMPCEHQFPYPPPSFTERKIIPKPKVGDVP